MWILVALGVVTGASVVRSAGYCSTNTFPTNTSSMHFSKEPVPYEYGFQDKFKSIHCCVKGYRSIEWFKDGVAYPWSAGVSNLILYPEAANQTLYTRRAARSDSGNYTCKLSNETHSETHTVRLNILEKPTDAPKTMFISKDQWVEEDSELRLFCEALIGRPYLADAVRDLRWRKVWPNGTEGDLSPTQTEIKTTREDVEDIIGSYLTISRVSAHDYGTYVCVVHSNDVVARNYVTVHYKFLEKEFDVLVCWTAVDGELVRGALLPTLALKYKYRVHTAPLSTTPDNWYSSLVCEVSRCRSLVAVLSPCQYSPQQLLTALRQLRALPVPPVVVLLQVKNHRIVYWREDVEDIIGSYLTISRVSAHDYGTYVCVVHSNDVVARNYVTVHYKYAGGSGWCGGPGVPWRAVAAGGAAGALPPWTGSWSAARCCRPSRSNTRYSSLVCEVSRCRSLVAVLSPCQYSPQQLLTALRQLRALPVPPVVVLLQDLPKLKREAKESGESLVEVLRRTRLVAWRHVHERAFWTQLRLALPLPPPRTQEKHVVETEESKNSRSGSLTALV
nr:uncharacterized protein LOC116766941 [Danaus plexippus plexippus]